MTHQQFKKRKGAITSAVRDAVKEAVATMGEDITGVTWFSPLAHDYVRQQQKAA